MASTIRRGIRFRLLTALGATALLGAPVAAATSADAAESALPAGRYVFATLADDRLAVMDAASRAIAQTIPLPGATGSPHPDLIADPTTPTLYATAGDSIAIVDAANPAIVGTLTDPGDSPFLSIAVSPDSRFVYGLTSDQHIVVFDQASRTALARVPTSGAPAIAMPRLLAASRDGVYATAGAVVDYLAVGDTAVSARIELAGTPGSLAVQAPGLPGLRPLYALQSHADGLVNIAIVSPDTREIVGNPENGFPLSPQLPIVMTADGTRVVGGTDVPTRLQAFNATPGEPGTTDATLAGPYGVPAIASENRATYVPLHGTATVAELPGVVRAPSGDLEFPGPVLAIAVVDVTTAPGPTPPGEPPSAAPPAPEPAPATTTGEAGTGLRILPATGIEPYVPFIVGWVVLLTGAALILARSALRRRRQASDPDDTPR